MRRYIVPIIMLISAKGADQTEDGVTMPVKNYEKGKTYNVSTNLAKCFYENGSAIGPEALEIKAAAAKKKAAKKPPAPKKEKPEGANPDETPAV